MQKCAVCGVEESEKIKIQQCSACKSIGYCSMKCQKENWANHKIACSTPIIIQRMSQEPEGQEKGNKRSSIRTSAVATRDIRVGEIILDEKPLFNIPYSHCCRPSPSPCSPQKEREQQQQKRRQSKTGIESLLMNLLNLGGGSSDSGRQCLTCGVGVDDEAKCSQCQSPICSMECQQSPVHFQNECPYLAAVSSTMDPSGCPPPFQKHSGGDANCAMKRVVQLRIALMKQKQPEIWSQIESLVDPKIEIADDYKMIQWLMKYKGFLHLQPFVPGANDEETEGFGKISCLYKIGSQIEHSCAPNTTATLGDAPDFKLRVRASIPLKKGDIINISRLTRHSCGVKGTAFRREAILRLYNYHCVCDLCCDVTERGTFMSAITCVKCRDSCLPSSSSCSRMMKSKTSPSPKQNQKKGKEEEEFGYFLPVSSTPSTDQNVSVIWECGRCGEEKSEREIMKFIKDLDQLVDSRLTEPNPTAMEKFISDFVRDYSKRVLHPNHFLLQLVVQKSMAFSLQKQRNDKFIEAGQYILPIIEKLSPGLSSHRAGLERHVSLSLLEMIQATPLPKSMASGELDKILRMIKECGELQEKALFFYQNSPPDRGAKTNNVAQLILREIEQLKTVELKIKRRYKIRN